MKRVCRKIATISWRRRQLAVTELLRNARVVSDPIKIASLRAKVARRDPRDVDTLYASVKHPDTLHCS
jgi:hypothetical protein